MSRLLVLTASVDIRNCPRVARIDVGERLSDYRSGLAAWLGRLDRHWSVLFVENSGFPLDEVEQVAARSAVPVHFWQYVESAGVTAQGKGAGEAAMLDRVVGSGHLDGHDWVVKCTGRLSVVNAGRILPPAPKEPAFSAPLRPDLTYADSRLFAATPEALRRYFRGLGADVDEPAGRYFEHALARAMHRGMADELRFVPLAELPLFTGVSGSTGARYGSRRAALLRRGHDRLRRLIHSRQLTL